MLNQEDIRKLILEKKLVENYVDLDTQLTPNGFDLTANSVFKFDTAGALDFSNKERVLPGCSEMIPKKQDTADKFGWWHLERGAYKVKTNETLNMPNDLIAIAFPRSSLLRMGAFTHNGVWDAGFKGKSEFILVIDNPQGMRLKQNARVTQLVFLPINESAHGYNGIYQNL
ncbi:MAG: deoxyuridine 5'-triphosphate nucleotidohydrolase [Deltaproteobacteria bacterium]